MIIGQEEQSRSVSNTDKRKDRTRSRPSTSQTQNKSRKGRNTEGTVNRYQPYQEGVGICFKFRDTGYCDFGQKCCF